MVTLGPWPKGMNNRAPDYAVPDGMCRNAVNVDFDNSGRPKRRQGLTKVYDGILTRSGYSCDIGSFFVENNSLKMIGTDFNTTTLYNGVGNVCAYDYINGVVCFTDGVISLQIDSSGNVSRWGIPVPGQITISQASGVLPSGQYIACCCFVDATGRESGNSPIVSLQASGGIHFSSLPSPPQGMSVRLYLSHANGQELYHVADTTANSYSVTTALYYGGNQFDNYFISPAPPGRIIANYAGRAYVAYGQFVYYSLPFRYDQFRRSEDYIVFPNDVDIMLPITAGIAFCYGSKTDMYLGTPEDGFTIVNKFDYGGIFGTGLKDSNSVRWQSQRGMVVCSSDGQCVNIQEDSVATDSANSGASIIIERDGIKKFVASLKQVSTGGLAAKSWISAEIIRRG